MSLRYTLGNPDYVPAFLFLQLNIRIEHSEVELLHKRVLHQHDLKNRQSQDQSSKQSIENLLYVETQHASQLRTGSGIPDNILRF